jgi:hypothetical protein
MMSDLIRLVRINISKIGGSELKAVATNESLRDLFKQKQALMSEMNLAKRKAMEDAAKPYLDAIEEVDQMYSMMLQFIGDNKE